MSFNRTPTFGRLHLMRRESARAKRVFSDGNVFVDTLRTEKHFVAEIICAADEVGLPEVGSQLLLTLTGLCFSMVEA